MSNSPTNKEQDQLIQLTSQQQNPGSAKPTDFVVEDRDGGQHDAALLAEAEKLNEPIPYRNAIPAQPLASSL